MLAAFAIAADLCCTMAGFKCCASRRGYRDRFLVSIPLGASGATGEWDADHTPPFLIGI
jgi:hypothetical protein